MSSGAKVRKHLPKPLKPAPIKNVNQSVNSPISGELEQQFELELCWCIQQLQTALKSGHLNNKQVQDHTKALNALMSNSPVIKKRQVMRLSFGDYRAKMAAEEKKRSKNALNMKVTPAAPCKKSIFLKKSSFVSSNENKFRFNFELSKENDVCNSFSTIKIESKGCNNSKEDNTKTNYLNFVPSDNSFRFKFNTNEVS